jgi:alginate O-acetyltransferase complex protein AlgI
MLFNSVQFLFGFLPIAYAVFWSLRTKDQRYVWLTVTGYVFYSFWNYKYCSLMLVSTLVSYFAGLGMLRSENPRTRRWFLVVPVAVDLLFLGYFKYAILSLQAPQNC